MRFGTLFRGTLLAVIIGWIVYTVALAGWSYFATTELVEKTLHEASTRYRGSMAAGSQSDALASYVRTSIVLAAYRDGLSLRAGDVVVSTIPGGLSATVHWSYPAISYQGSDLFVIPMSVKRSLVMGP